MSPSPSASFSSACRLSWNSWPMMSILIQAFLVDSLTDLQDLQVCKIPTIPWVSICSSSSPWSSLYALEHDILDQANKERWYKVSLGTIWRTTHLCMNQALVTKLSFSLQAANMCGLRVTTTTLFCTVLLVTSSGLLSNSFASSCRVHDMPKREVAGKVEVTF